MRWGCSPLTAFCFSVALSHTSAPLFLSGRRLHTMRSPALLLIAILAVAIVAGVAAQAFDEVSAESE